MTDSRPHTTLRHAATAVLLAMLGLALFATPSGAQYGGAPQLFVDPVQVDIDGSFDAVGFDCPAGSAVTITIDGFPGTLATTVAEDDSSYAVTDIAMPAGVVAGEEYDVRASCAGGTSVFRITAVCNGGSLPIAGSCPDGRTVGGEDPGTQSVTTTTTVPGGAGGAGSGTGGSGTGGIGGRGLAVTGATFAEQAIQIGATLVALGAIIVLVAARRRTDPAT